MREHIFRGKDKYERWWYGDLVQMTEEVRTVRTDKTYIKAINYGTDQYGEKYESIIKIEVDFETVGQYTGLKDKNKKKIFEGDILLTDATIEDYGDMQIPFEVEWCNGGFCLVSPAYVITPPFYDTVLDYAEITGNIYDNSNLLMRKIQ